MSRHVVVDGSNLATEGRSLPSLHQLNEAVLAYLEENPHDIITVVVDATFGHRIDAKEVAEFDEAIENNELVSPPAGAIGRGDAFVLQIAKKAHAIILSNDSFQEFHGEHEWLFDEGRLVGGKPVPHVGWVFVPRAPVRGMISRRATRVAKRDPKVAARPSVSASQPMPVPKSPPPGRRGPRMEAPAAAAAVPEPKPSRSQVAAAKAAAGPKPAPPAAPKGNPTNELMAFLSFVEHHPVGSTLEATFESYSSHGAYAVTADGVHIYVPMRSMAVPAPRSAREVVALGEKRAVVIVSFNAARRGIDAALPGLAPTSVVVVPAVAEPKPVKGAGRKKAAPRTAKPDVEAVAPVVVVAPTETSARPSKVQDKPSAKPRKAASSKKAVEPSAPVVETPVIEPVQKAAPKKAVAKKAAAPVPQASKTAPAKKVPADQAPAADKAPAAERAPAAKRVPAAKKISTAEKAPAPVAEKAAAARKAPAAKKPLAPSAGPKATVATKSAAVNKTPVKAVAAAKKAAPKAKPASA
jgi:Zc3h12a-like Ribonuclease NYN domain